MKVIHSLSAVISVFLFLTIIGCGQANPPEATPASQVPHDTSTSPIGFCSVDGNIPSEPAQGEIKRGIVSGRVTDRFQSVVHLKVDHFSSCTGTVVSSNTIITAAHCVINHLSFKVGELSAIKSIASNEDTDVAVLVFEPGSFKVKPSVVNTQKLVGNEPITLVGFGQTDYIKDNEIDGLKRIGCNKLMGFADFSDAGATFNPNQGAYLHFRSHILSEDKRSMTGRGDSGGPIFANGKIIGVVSFGGTVDSLFPGGKYSFNDPSRNEKEIYEFDTNLASPGSMKLLRKAVKEIGAEIPGY